MLFLLGGHRSSVARLEAPIMHPVAVKYLEQDVDQRVSEQIGEMLSGLTALFHLSCLSAR